VIAGLFSSSENLKPKIGRSVEHDDTFQAVPQARRARRERSADEWRSARKWALPILLVLYLIWRFLFSGGGARAEVIDFSKSVERIEELSTVKSHMRFGVVVREEGGNVIVRRLADQAESIGMDGIGSVLFEDPTMIVELHGVATYGITLDDLASRIRQDDSVVWIPLPSPSVLDAKLVAADTRIVAQMKGLFRSSNQTLLLEAGKHGEKFVRDYAKADTTLLSLASERARNVLRLLVEQGGKRAVFE